MILKLFLAIFFIGLAAAGCSSKSCCLCDSNKMQLEKTDNKQYYVNFFFKANWYRASQFCRYHGMHLVSISSQKEQDQIDHLIKDMDLAKDDFWTSGNDNNVEGSFIWESTGRPINYTNWFGTEPNNEFDLENCIRLLAETFKWNDAPCKHESYFICEV